MVPKDEALEPELHAVTVPEIEGAVGFPRGTGFVVDGADAEGFPIGADFGFDEVHFGDNSQTGRTEFDRSRMDGIDGLFSLGSAGGFVGGSGVGRWLVGFGFLPPGLGKGSTAFVDATMKGATADGIGAFHEDLFHVLVVEQAWAVDELIEHPRLEKGRGVVGVWVGDGRKLGCDGRLDKCFEGRRGNGGDEDWAISQGNRLRARGFAGGAGLLGGFGEADFHGLGDLLGE